MVDVENKRFASHRCGSRMQTRQLVIGDFAEKCQGEMQGIDPHDSSAMLLGDPLGLRMQNAGDAGRRPQGEEQPGAMFRR